MSKSSRPDTNTIHVVGHPSAPIGMGEHARSVFKALHAAGHRARMVDIYGPEMDADRDLIRGYAEYETRDLGRGVNLFCVNADEVEQAFQTLRERNLRASGARNIIYPAWELASYPDEWGEILNDFDEVWAPSQFIADALRPATKSPVVHMPLACEIGARALLSRSYFKIPESAYCFLFAFDFLSYVERKNPFAILDAFEKAVEMRPGADIRLVLKLNNTHRKPADFEAFKKHFGEVKDKVVIVDGTLEDLEMKALAWLSDCFVSLHRSEGFGRGISEAMALGKPVIATGYSGNMDFCRPDNAFLVPYELISVGANQYPHWKGQVWADVDTDAAARLMVQLIDDPAQGMAVGKRARQTILGEFSFLKRGLAYLEQCQSWR